MTKTAFTAREFRKALGQFATGVTVITVEREPGQVFGMTANAFTSVSLNPMLILVCVEEKAKILPLLHKKKHFGVSVLKQHQQAVSEYFAQSVQNAEAEQRLALHYRWTPSNVPVLEGTSLQLSCTVVAEHVAGDHTIFVAKVDDAEIPGGEPLLFFRGEYRHIARQ
ncbi:MAG TPA: flavin reductase family protein [Candidatus Angelobacter sp.]|nr:flavin reductase family protein [Candidatus Angelobacter sp.]